MQRFHWKVKHYISEQYFSFCQLFVRTEELFSNMCLQVKMLYLFFGCWDKKLKKEQLCWVLSFTLLLLRFNLPQPKSRRCLNQYLHVKIMAYCLNEICRFKKIGKNFCNYNSTVTLKLDFSDRIQSRLAKVKSYQVAFFYIVDVSDLYSHFI